MDTKASKKTSTLALFPHTPLRKGLSGSVTSVAPGPKVLVSTALDRFSRIHSTYPPTQGAQQEKKGEVLDKIYTKSIPTVVLWDKTAPSLPAVDGDEVAEDDDIWNTLQHVEDDSMVG